MQNIRDRLLCVYDISCYFLYKGCPTRSSLIHGLKHQGKLTYLTFTVSKLSDQKLNFRD